VNITLDDLRNMFCKAIRIVLVNDIIGKDGTYLVTDRMTDKEYRVSKTKGGKVK
jgi:hypothetical protein